MAFDVSSLPTVKVLDHGMVRPVDVMGDDAAVVQAARVSYGEGTKSISEDTGLIRYLMRHWHSTPFEMCEIKLHCVMPIFVARQWVRHRTANINEMSARYSILPDKFYIPDAEQIAKQSAANAQGRDEVFDRAQALNWQLGFREHAEMSYALYKNMTDDEMARELARMVLPPNIYTEWYWKIDAHNLMHFLRLRADPHAQYEIRVYAEAMLDIFAKWLPRTFGAFMDYRLRAETLSHMEVVIVRELLAGRKASDDYTSALNAMSKRERGEMEQKLDITL